MVNPVPNRDPRTDPCPARRLGGRSRVRPAVSWARNQNVAGGCAVSALSNVCVPKVADGLAGLLGKTKRASRDAISNGLEMLVCPGQVSFGRCLLHCRPIADPLVHEIVLNSSVAPGGYAASKRSGYSDILPSRSVCWSADVTA